MTEVPRIVHYRLQAASEQTAQERTHPDADLLTAFAEQALSVTERDGVIEHLSHCGDCREVVALALLAEDALVAPNANETDDVRVGMFRPGAPTSRKLNFAWPSLRWAAFAVATAVVAAVLLIHPEKPNQATLPSVNRQGLPPTSGTQIASVSTDQSPVAAATDKTRPKSELQFSKTPKARSIVTRSLQAKNGMLLAGNTKDSGRPHKLPGAGITAFDQNASAIRGTNETVQVSSEAVAVEVAPSTDGSLMARNDAPAIEKAKPAPPGSDANEPQESNETIVPGAVKLANRNVMAAAKLSSAMNKASADNFAWAISAGVLRHSLDGGQSWQNALHADHPLLCYASHDQDVWAGGETGALFHSTDGGLTWANVKPSIEAQQLSSGITHIDLSWDVNRLREIVVSTSNNEVWSSADGGNTWNKK